MSKGIAIVGLSCRYPGAQNARELWENILARRRQFRKIPRCRLPLDEYYDPKASDKTYATRAAVMDLLKFDWVAHRIPKSSYEGTDWVHWLAYQVAIEAVADAGYTRESIPRRKTGVLLGNTLCGEQTRTLGIRLRWPFIARSIEEGASRSGMSARATRRLLTEAEAVLKSVFPMLTEDSLAGAMSNTIAGRIASVFDLDGGGYVVDGACASSLLAAALAADKLEAGDLDLAIVGGVDVSIDPLEMVGYAGAGALTPGDMNVYNRLSNGFILGEGCGMVLLKRLEDARRDKNTIYAVIRGWGTASGGHAARAVKSAIVRAHQGAGYTPAELDFIEGHGSGIPDVDRAELEGVYSAIRSADRAAGARRCGITSIKPLIGHTKGAAGVAGLISATLAVNRRVLPPTAGLHLPHQLFDATQPWLYPLVEGTARSADTILRAGVTAIGASGVNCHVTLESHDAPLDRLAPAISEASLLRSARETEVFLFSADTAKALYDELEAAALDAEGASFAELTDLAAQLAQRATAKAGAFRAAIVAHSPESLVAAIELLRRTDLPYRSVDGRIWAGEVVSGPARVGFAYLAGDRGLLARRRILRRLGLKPAASRVIDLAKAKEQLKTFASECDLILDLGPAREISVKALEHLGRDKTPCLPIESRPGNDRDRHVVAAALFAHGHDLDWKHLHEGRLVRPFISPRDRAFFRNPCERPFAPRSKDQVAPAIVETGWAERLGVGTELLQDYVEKRGGVITELIRADLKQLAAARELELPSSFIAVPTLSERAVNVTASGENSEADGAGKEIKGGDDIEGSLIKLIIEKTGYPEASVSLESRLLDDLNLDSIKAAEVVGTTAQTFGAEGKIDASMFANASIQEIAGAIRVVRTNEGVDLGAMDDGPRLIKNSDIADPPWVRNFASGILVPSPLPPDLSGSMREAEDWTSAVVLILADQEEANPLARALANHVSKLGATVSIWPFSAENALERGRFSHTFAILPPASASHAELISKLHAAALVSSGPNRLPRQRVNALIFVAPEDTGIVSFGASVHLERARQRLRVIELSNELPHDRASDLIVREVEADTNWAAARYDASAIRRELHCRLQDRQTYTPRKIEWSAADVVLATGGARGITAECALAFARATGVKLALVGNSQTHPEVDATLARAKEEGLTARYYACNVTNETLLAETIQQIEKDLGPITGVIHGAGLNIPKTAEQLSKEEALAQLCPKVQGAANLMRLLDPTRLKIFSALTSIIGVAGIQGNAWYALANELTDLTLRNFHEKTGVPVLAAAYGIWSEVGMGARLGAVASVEKVGTAAIPPVEGSTRFVELMLKDPGCRQVVVAARLAALDTWRTEPLSVQPRARRYLDKIMRAETGVDVVVRTHLDLERDPYLKDHTWSGSPLFPAVFGLEAMAQVVALVTQRSDFDSKIFAIEDLRLERPIIVHPEYGAEIQISAQVLEGPQKKVTARVTTKQLGFKTECFSATFVLDPPAINEPLAIVDQPAIDAHVRPEDFYGSHLFHGPDYQRIVEVAEVSRDRVRVCSELDRARAATASGQSELFTVDPFFLDTLLHGMALGRLESVALPTRIAKIRLDYTKVAAKSAAPVLLTIKDVDDDEYLGDAIARDEHGHVFATMEGVCLKTIEHRAEASIKNTQRDATAIRSALAAGAGQFGVAAPPSIDIAHTPGIHRDAREERRKRALPLLAQVAEKWRPESAQTITWATNGKPTIATGDVSLSHDGDLCLAVAGPAPQGCDLVIVDDRSLDQWVTMLGNRRRALLEDLEKSEHSNIAGARVWAAIEATRKTGKSGYEVRFLERHKNSVLLESKNEDGSAPLLILTTAVVLGGEKRAVIAVVVERSGEAIEPARLAG